MYVSSRVSFDNNICMAVSPMMSFVVMYGWNWISFVFLFGPNGLFDLVWCRNSDRVTATAAIVKDTTKSRVQLALSTANPLTQVVLSCPKFGVAESRF
jgi:hypothetical protein